MRLFPLLALVSLLGVEAPRALAGFRPPVRVSAETKISKSFQLGFDFFENLTLAYDEEGSLILETRGNDLLDKSPLGEGENPSLAFDSQGALVAFSAPADSSTERKVFLLKRVGSQSPRHAFSQGAGDDRFPQVQVISGRDPVVVWERRLPRGPSRVWFRREERPAVDLGRGERPAVALDNLGRAHVFFLRDGDIFYAREESSSRPGIFTPPSNVTATPLEESPPHVATADGRVLFLCFAREGNIYLASNRAGKFTEPKLVAEGGAENPSLSISPTGTLAIAFEKGGDIFSILGTTFFLPAPVRALETEELESDPFVAVDSFANVFIGFKRQDALYYLTDAGPPMARFEAEPLKGEAPLSVGFKDKSTGGATGWSWDFGDGTFSREQNPLHVYERSGGYTASLKVAGPGGESPILDRKAILVTDPQNEMKISPVSAFPGQRGLNVPVLATHSEHAQGFTIAAIYDPAFIEVSSVEFDSTNIVGLKPELFAVNISDDPEEPFVTAGILFDIEAPFDGRVIPPGKNHRIANILVNVRPEVAPGTETRMELRNQVGRPPLNNIFTVDGFSVLPVLGEGSTIAIQHLRFPPPRFFRRGDADGNGLVNITDVIATLDYLFTGTEALDCHDAADVTDDGRIDISDAAYTLNFLFQSGSYPPPPYPELGLDPSEDDLPPCLLR